MTLAIGDANTVDRGMIAILSGTSHNLGKAVNIEILAGASSGDQVDGSTVYFHGVEPLEGDRVQEETDTKEVGVEAELISWWTRVQTMEVRLDPIYMLSSCFACQLNQTPSLRSGWDSCRIRGLFN